MVWVCGRISLSSCWRSSRCPRTSALSLSLLASAEGIFWSLIGGMVYMGLREKEHLSEVTSESVNGNN